MTLGEPETNTPFYGKSGESKTLNEKGRGLVMSPSLEQIDDEVMAK